MRMKELSECRVLIVDDTKANIRHLLKALHGEYKFSIAMDGESALHMAERNPPDLILLDIVMPGIDGYEVCRQIRASASLHDIPIMFLSSLEDVRDKARGFELGANDYLVKPFEELEVRARVRSLIKAKAYADAMREAMEVELNTAREIQMGILPSNLSSCTDGTGLDIQSVIEPARQVGGDLFDVLRVGDDRLVVIIGDVSGKGIPAAMFMAVTVTLARTMARLFDRPEEILKRLNRELEAQNPLCMFVSIVCLVFDLPTGRVSCANAGHNPLLFIGADGLARFVFHSTGKVAGIDPVLGVECETMLLSQGDSLVLYTDGVTEAFNAKHEAFENARLLNCLQGSPVESAGDAVSGILAAVRQHAADTPQSDDIAIVAIRRSGTAALCGAA